LIYSSGEILDEPTKKAGRGRKGTTGIGHDEKEKKKKKSTQMEGKILTSGKGKGLGS